MPVRIRPRVSPLAAQVMVISVVGVVLAAAAVAGRLWSLEANDAAFRAAESAAQIEQVVHHSDDTQRELDLALDAVEAGEPFPAAVATEAGYYLGEAIYAAYALNEFQDSGPADDIVESLEAADSALLDLAETGSREDYDALSGHLDDALVAATALQPLLDDEMTAERSRAESAATLSLVMTLALGLAGAVIVLTITWKMGRQMSEAARHAEARSIRLEDSSRVIEQRNRQFRALYQVLTELNDTLDPAHVLRSALHEGRRLMEADVAAVWLLDGDELARAGVEDSSGPVTLEDSMVLPLGEGLHGKVARRGRLLRIESGASDEMVADERVPGAESGIVAPLIVGARIIGTISFWSARPGAFDRDEAQLVEMMASQVASAWDQAERHSATAREARHDPLTGVLNRRQLDMDIAGDVQHAVDMGHGVAIVMFDIDHFKALNDRHGHKAGDATLRRVAAALAGGLRGDDRLYRYGGEEFCAVLKGVDAATAVPLADRLRQAVALASRGGAQAGIAVTISAGMALGPDHSNSASDLIALADAALYAAKRDGRDQVVLYDPALGLEPRATEAA